jgi:hypothetical protein
MENLHLFVEKYLQIRKRALFSHPVFQERKALVIKGNGYFKLQNHLWQQGNCKQAVVARRC